MRFSEKLLKYIEGKKAQLQRGVEVTEQLKAERLRKKFVKIEELGPGSIRYGMAHKQNPLDFMHDVYDKRKAKRKDKE